MTSVRHLDRPRGGPLRRAPSFSVACVRPVGRWPASLGLDEDYVIDVLAAPEALSERLRAAINTRPRRVLGVFKVRSEWIGAVAGNEFVVWEKQGHATRASGRIRGRRGGSRVEARISVTRRTRVLGVIFFALFAVAAGGLLAREEGLGGDPAGVVVAVAGGVATLVFFWSAALRQRAALRRFLSDVFAQREVV